VPSDQRRRSGADGIADQMLPATDFDRLVAEHATQLARHDDYDRLLEQKLTGRTAAEARKPLEAYRVEELAEMSRDIFDDRNGFAEARRAFVTKQKPGATPARLAVHRPSAPSAAMDVVTRFAS
jgi:putative two-component system protein, hydrogenase maturation factor HypX/HoxX